MLILQKKPHLKSDLRIRLSNTSFSIFWSQVGLYAFMMYFHNYTKLSKYIPKNLVLYWALRPWSQAALQYRGQRRLGNPLQVSLVLYKVVF